MSQTIIVVWCSFAGRHEKGGEFVISHQLVRFYKASSIYKVYRRKKTARVWSKILNSKRLFCLVSIIRQASNFRLIGRFKLTSSELQTVNWKWSHCRNFAMKLPTLTFSDKAPNSLRKSYKSSTGLSNRLGRTCLILLTVYKKYEREKERQRDHERRGFGFVFTDRKLKVSGQV